MVLYAAVTVVWNWVISDGIAQMRSNALLVMGGDTWSEIAQFTYGANIAGTQDIYYRIVIRLLAPNVH